MLTERRKEIAGKIWEIANRLRGPYRPPQYQLVMLPMVVLRRLDCVLEPTKDAVLAEHARLVAANTPENAIPRLLTRVVNQDRQQPLYNTSPYTFQKLLGDSENIAPNKEHGMCEFHFSPTAYVVLTIGLWGAPASLWLRC